MGKNKQESSYITIFNILKELYISSFSWNKCPLELNVRFLEMSLFEKGSIIFFKDEDLGYLTLRGNINSMIDVYGEPTNVRVYGSNGYHNTRVNHKDCVIIYNNKVRDSPYLRIQEFAKRIWNLEKTIDINVHAQRTPLIIKCSKKQELTLKNVYMHYDGYKPIIFVDDEMDLSKFNVMNTNAPYVADKLEDLRRKLWNEALSFIGIQNNYSEKNERLTDDEVLVSNGLAISNRNAKMQAREEAVKEINEMFGLEIEIKANNLSFADMSNGDVDNIGGDDNE